MPGTAREHFEYTVKEWTTYEFSRLYDMIPEEPGFIFDIGANAGGFSQVMHDQFPSAQIYAVEPIRDNYAELSKCTFLVGLCKAAVQYGTNSTRMFWRIGNIGAYFTEEVDAGPDKDFSGETVDCVTLEELAYRFGCVPDLVKLDVEGAEENIIEHSTLLKTTPYIIVEWHPDLDPYSFFVKHLPDHRIVVDLQSKQFLLCRD